MKQGFNENPGVLVDFGVLGSLRLQFMTAQKDFSMVPRCFCCRDYDNYYRKPGPAQLIQHPEWGTVMVAVHETPLEIWADTTGLNPNSKILLEMLFDGRNVITFAPELVPGTGESLQLPSAVYSLLPGKQKLVLKGWLKQIGYNSDGSPEMTTEEFVFRQESDSVATQIAQKDGVDTTQKMGSLEFRFYQGNITGPRVPTYIMPTDEQAYTLRSTRNKGHIEYASIQPRGSTSDTTKNLSNTGEHAGIGAGEETNQRIMADPYAAVGPRLNINTTLGTTRKIVVFYDYPWFLLQRNIPIPQPGQYTAPKKKTWR